MPLKPNFQTEFDQRCAMILTFHISEESNQLHLLGFNRFLDFVSREALVHLNLGWIVPRT